MNFLKYIKKNQILDLSLQANINIEELVDFLWSHTGIKGMRLRYCLVAFAESHDRASYNKLLLLAKSFKAGYLSHIEHLDLSDNQFGKIIFNRPQDSEDYNIILQWSYVPIVNTVSSFINAIKYYYQPEKNPACKLNPPCSLLEYFGQSLAIAKLPYLINLSLNNTGITDYDLGGICNSFIHGAMPQLKTLELSNNSITCFGVENISHVIRCKKLMNLHELNLSGNYISNLGVIKLLQAFEYVKDTKIKTINFEYNTISVGIIDNIISALKKLPNITNIDLKGNEISKQVLSDLQELVNKTINKRNKKLLEVKRSSKMVYDEQDESDDEMYLSTDIGNMEMSMDSNSSVINRNQLTRSHIVTRSLDDDENSLVIHLIPVEHDASTLGGDSIDQS